VRSGFLSSGNSYTIHLLLALGSISKTLQVFTLFEADQPRRNSFYTLAVRGQFLDLDHLDRQLFLSAQILGRCIYWQLNETDTVFVGL
jgi:hypothetical protein